MSAVRKYFIILILFTLIAPVLAQAQLFAPKVDYTVGLRPWTLVSADFDGDGDFDLATAVGVAFDSDGEGWVSILMNIGDGTFAPSVNYDVGDVPSLTASDLDKDGDIDLAAADYFTHKIYILLNNGAGAFVVADSFATGGLNPEILCAADLDGDGDNDLAVPNIGSDNVSIFFNNGDAAFTGPVLYPMGAGAGPVWVISADLDSDSDSDLVVTNNGSQRVSVMLNDGTGVFAPGGNYTVGSGAHGLSLADYNGDGCLDLAVGNVSNTFVSMLMGNCDGTFDPQVPWTACSPVDIASADYDIDGDIDMAVANPFCNSVSIFLNNGNGTFAPHFTLAGGFGTHFVVARDFNADCVIDLAAANWDNFVTPGDNVSILINLTINQPPVLDPLTPESLYENSSVSFRVHFADPSICQASLACTNPPTNASFMDSGNTAGAFTFSPNTSQAGNYNIIFVASDGILADTDSVAITVLNCTFKPGDVNGDGSVNLTDVIGLVNHVFRGDPAPIPSCKGNVNGVSPINLSDVIYLVNRVFRMGPPPVKTNVCCL